MQEQGLATTWAPHANNIVYSIAVNGSIVYAGGDFGLIGGQTRNKIAAIDAGTGSATIWAPHANNTVYSIAVNGSTVYAGVFFTNIGGQPRNRIAAIDAGTGLATTWNPDANFNVFTIAVNGSTVYAGGVFAMIGGQFRPNIAALDAVTGLATAWNPNANGPVRTIAVNGSAVYAGGDFINIGGQSRNRIAALDVATGLANTWNPNANNTVLAIAANGSNVYAGGNFGTINGAVQPRFAAFAINTTLPVQLLSFTAKLQNPGASKTAVVCNWTTTNEENSSHFIIERNSDRSNFVPVGRVAATGNSSVLQHYSFIDNTPVKGIVYYRLKSVDQNGKNDLSPIVAVNAYESATFLLIYPNPLKNEATLAITVATKQTAGYSLFDYTGRELLSGSLSLNKGANIINLPLEHLPAGSYLIKLSGTTIFKQSQLIKQ